MNSMRFDFSFVCVRALCVCDLLSPLCCLLRHMHPHTHSLFKSFHTILYLTIFIKSPSLDLSTASAVRHVGKKTEPSLCYSYYYYLFSYICCKYLSLEHILSWLFFFFYSIFGWFSFFFFVFIEFCFYRSILFGTIASKWWLFWMNQTNTLTHYYFYIDGTNTSAHIGKWHTFRSSSLLSSSSPSSLLLSNNLHLLNWCLSSFARSLIRWMDGWLDSKSEHTTLSLETCRL